MVGRDCPGSQRFERVSCRKVSRIEEDTGRLRAFTFRTFRTPALRSGTHHPGAMVRPRPAGRLDGRGAAVTIRADLYFDLHAHWAQAGIDLYASLTARRAPKSPLREDALTMAVKIKERG